MHLKKKETLIIQANKDFNWKQSMMFENWMHNLVTRFGFKFPPNILNEQINTLDIIFCFALFFLEGGGGGWKVLTID